MKRRKVNDEERIELLQKGYSDEEIDEMIVEELYAKDIFKRKEVINVREWN